MRSDHTLLLLALFTSYQFCEGGKKRRDSSSEEEQDEDWNVIACSAYETCLQSYDQIVLECGKGKKGMEENTDLCYVPIAKQYLKLMEEKERRNKILRNCYVTGQVEDLNAEIKEQEMGKRKKSTCRHKIAELEQYASSLASIKNKKGQQHESCSSVSRKFKEKCNKIEPCCNRVKDCRKLVSSHPITESMKAIETGLKEDRRECKESFRGLDSDS